jgi:polyhydroxybutyrate depolymerase
MSIEYAGRLARCAVATLVVTLAACAGRGAVPAAAEYAEIPVAREVTDAQVLLTGAEFARCLADHGVADFPDFIVHNGRLGWADETAAGRAALALGNAAARNACQPILDPMPASRVWTAYTPTGLEGARPTGCAPTRPAGPGTSTRQTIVSGGRSRSYLLHLPFGYPGVGGLPLVMAFHGAMDGPAPRILEDLERATGFSRLADREAFIVVYPRSTTTRAGRIAWSIGAPDGPSVDDAGFVADLVDHLIATLCVDPDRVYATGFSSGGGMTGLLACRAADRFAAFAAVSGAFYVTPGRCAPSRPVPILEFHGTSDKVPYGGGPHRGGTVPSIPQWLQGWAERDGCTRGPTVFFAMVDVVAEHWTRCAGSSTVMHYRVLNGQHTWPGGAGATQTIDATSLIWEFFRTHQIPPQP